MLFRSDDTAASFDIESNDFIKIKPSQNFSEDQAKYKGMLSTLVSKYNLAPGDSVIEGSMWKQCKQTIEENLLSTGNAADPEIIKMLVKRTVWGATIPMKQIKEKVNEEFYNWYSKWLKHFVISLANLLKRPNTTQVLINEECGRFEWSCLDWNKPSRDFYESRGQIS